MVKHFFIFSFVFLSGATHAEGSPLTKACHRLTQGNGELTRKCAHHAEYFELRAAFVEACSAFNRDLDVRMKCLKSGANLEILEICQSSGWSLNGTLTCLRSYPTRESMGACKKFGANEEEQIRCLRLGREVPQVATCMEIGHDQASRFSCLQMDIPVFEARRCSRKNKSQEGLTSCFEDVVAEREGEYWRDQNALRGRGLASENPPIPAPVKMKKKK